jgi:hypothetical protein
VNGNWDVVVVVIAVVVTMACVAVVVVVVNIMAFDVEVDNVVEAFFDEHAARPKVPKDINPKVRKIPMNLKCLLCIASTPY